VGVDLYRVLGVTEVMEPPAKHQRHTGKIKFFDKDRGFGFVAPDDGGRDVFVHISAVQRAGVPYLEDGMLISYSTEDDARGRGPQAMNLQLL
jgi:cold shock protein